MNTGENTKTSFTYTTENSHLEQENILLRETVSRLDQELRRLKTPALMVCELQTLLNNNQAIIKIPNGNKFMTLVAKDCEKLQPGDQVLVEQKNLNVVRKLELNQKFGVEKYVIINKPNETWKDIGGHKKTIRELREVIELPIKKPKLFKKVGIKPPKGVLLYGPPGTGKTLLAKALANSTNSTFIEVVGSELVQKFIGEGAKLVKEIFELARTKKASIVFIDELDALAAKRVELGTSGEREVNRTFIQLLAEIDGFQHLGNVKIIAATNRKDILDPAILRPGRLDRLVEVESPDQKGREEILTIHTKEMTLNKDIDLEQLSKEMEDMNGSEIRSICTEAGYFAIRGRRTEVKKQDFTNAIKKIKAKEEQEEFSGMFG